LAALELQNSRIKVIDIALKYGYDSPVSFARAFQVLHGVTPTEARADGVILKAYPRISFQMSIKGEKEMDYRIETKEAFQVFGFEEIFRVDEKGRKPADLWEQCHADGKYEKLFKDAGNLPTFVNQNLCKVHAVCSYKKTTEDTFPYMVGALRSEDSCANGYTVAEIPAHTWAIFPSGKYNWDDFDKVIGTMYKRFFTEWLPTSNYDQVGGLGLELYGGDDELGYVELWFAVNKKS